MERGGAPSGGACRGSGLNDSAQSAVERELAAVLSNAPESASPEFIGKRLPRSGRGIGGGLAVKCATFVLDDICNF